MANIKQILRTCFLIIMLPCGIIIPGLIIYAFFSSVVGPRITAMGACSNYPGCLYGVVNGQKSVSVLGFSDDNARLLSRGLGGHTLIHDATNGRSLKRLNIGDTNYRYSIASDRSEIIAYDKNNVKVFDWDGELVRTWIPEAETTVEDVVRVPLVKGFLVAEESGVSVRHGDGSLIAWLREGDGYVRVATSANGDYVAAYNAPEQRVMVWPLQRLRDGVMIQEENLSSVIVSRDPSFLQLSDDGSLVAVQGQKGAYVWETGDGSLVMAVEPEQELRITAAALSPVGNRLAVGFNNGAIGIFDVATKAMVERFDLSNSPSRLMFDPDGNRLAMGLSSTSRVSGGELIFSQRNQDANRAYRPPSILRQSNNRISRRPGYAMVWSIDPNNSPD